MAINTVDQEERMAKAKAKSRKTGAGESVYRITELVGTSQDSCEDAATHAHEPAAG